MLSVPAELLLLKLVKNLELLKVRLSSRLEEVLGVDEDPRSVNVAEPDDDTTFVDELDPAGADGL